MRAVRLRSLLTGLATLVALVGSGTALAPAMSVTDDHASPTVTDVHVKHGHVEAVVSVPGSAPGAGIDPGSLRVSFGDGPELPAQATPLAHERRAAMVMIDTSGSMTGAGIAAAKSAARTFLADVPADVEVGLGSFADRPRVLLEPTTDRASLRSALKGLHANGSTSLYDAVRLAVHALGDSGSRTLVLLSDGSDTTSKASLADVTKTVRGSDVALAVIGFQTSDADNAPLTSIAGAGGGSVTTALDADSLRQAFSAAARKITTRVKLRVPVPADARGDQKLTVSGTVNGQAFQVGAPGSLAATAPAVEPAATSEHPSEIAAATSNWKLWVAAGAVFLGLLMLVLALASSVFTPEARRRIRSLDRYVGEVTQRVSASGMRHGSQNLAGTALRAADLYIRSHSSVKRTARTALLLERADLPLRLNEWYVLRVVATVVAVAVCYLLIGGGLVATVVAVVLGVLVAAVVPPLLLNFLAKRRARKFEIQLPDVLTLVATSLATGFSLPQALDEVARNAAEPAAKEFARALAETRIGTDLEDALERTATRMDSTNLAWTTMAIRIQRNVGGNLAETLRTTAQTLRERESLRRQVRALSAEGRLSAYILLALPIFLGLYLLVTNRPYLALLWSEPLGIAMLGVGVVLLVIGSFWMKKTVEVKV